MTCGLIRFYLDPENNRTTKDMLLSFIDLEPEEADDYEAYLKSVKLPYLRVEL